MNRDKRIKVAVTGYFGTGSSAVIDLLKEYKNVTVVPENGRAYEHSVFFVPGGLFELCSKLLHGNSPQGSDMVVNDFIDAMKRLNDNDFGWFGSYKKLFGNRFMDIVLRFVDRISEKRTTSNSNHELKVRFSLAKALAQYALHIAKGRKVSQYGKWYVEDGKPVYFSMPSENELYEAAREFTDAYFHLFETATTSTHIVLDHLIWPQQADTYSKCFDETLKIIVVDRDPRDVYISDQHLWATPHFPSDMNVFIEEWRRSHLPVSTASNVLHVHFEDLVYNYENTTVEIETFLNIPHENHIRCKEFFRPEMSIENTQVFLLREEWEKIAQHISTQLSTHIYNFEEKRIPNKKLIFE